MSAALELQKAVYDALVADQNVTELLNGPHVFDGEPDRRNLPYVLFGTIESDDWSTGTEYGEEHLLELSVWSSADGRKEVTLVADALRQALLDLAPWQGNHQLVNFSWETLATRRANDHRHFIATLTFRAVTEPVTA